MNSSPAAPTCSTCSKRETCPKPGAYCSGYISRKAVVEAIVSRVDELSPLRPAKLPGVVYADECSQNLRGSECFCRPCFIRTEQTIDTACRRGRACAGCGATRCPELSKTRVGCKKFPKCPTIKDKDGEFPQALHCHIVHWGGGYFPTQGGIYGGFVQCKQCGAAIHAPQLAQQMLALGRPYIFLESMFGEELYVFSSGNTVRALLKLGGAEFMTLIQAVRLPIRKLPEAVHRILDTNGSEFGCTGDEQFERGYVTYGPCHRSCPMMVGYKAWDENIYYTCGRRWPGHEKP